MSRKIKLDPGAKQMVYALAHQPGMSVHAAACELIDNSLDAGATTVEFLVDNQSHRIVITDNGRGTDNIGPIVTPFKHGKHEETNEFQSGWFGQGGTLSQIWLCQGKGVTEVESRTKEFVYKIMADFAEMSETDNLEAGEEDVAANDEGTTGTIISISNCITISAAQIGQAQSNLSWRFTPALRKNAKIILDLDGNRRILEAYKIPPHNAKVKEKFDIDGKGVDVRCFLLKPGQKNRAKGWAVCFAHRIMDIYREPAEIMMGDRSPDFSRLYAEVYLSRAWKDCINVHKDGFVTSPDFLWKELARICAPIMDRIEQEGTTIELNESIQTAREILDTAMGFGWKAKRRGPQNQTGRVNPTNNGSSHTDATVKQDGYKPEDGKGGRAGARKRIRPEWSEDLESLYEVRPSLQCIYVLLSKNAQCHAKYQVGEAGEYLAQYILHIVSADIHSNPSRYKDMHVASRGESIPQILEEMLSKIVSANPIVV